MRDIGSAESEGVAPLRSYCLLFHELNLKFFEI